MARKSAELPQFQPPQSTPPTPPESIKDFRIRTGSISTAADIDDNAPQITRTFSCTSRILSTKEYFLDWAFKFLGIIATIIFGIYAPVSYNAQTNGNASNDEAQAKLVEKMDSLREDVEYLKMQEDVVGALKAWEFCEKHAKMTLSACRSLSSTLNINSLIQDLASMNPKHKPSSRRTAQLAPSTATLASAASSTSSATVGTDIVSRATGEPSPFSQPTHVMSQSPQSLPLPTTPAISFPGFLKPGHEIGDPFQSAVILGFCFGIVLAILTAIGAFQVVKRKNEEKEREWRGLGART